MLLTFPNIENIDRLVDDKESPLLFQPSLLFVCIRFYKNELWVGRNIYFILCYTANDIKVSNCFDKMSSILNCDQFFFFLSFNY